MKDTVYLVISRHKVERMTKGMPSLSRGEIPVKLLVEVKDGAFGAPTIERHVVVESALDGLALSDLDLRQNVITEAEAELIRARRLEAMKQILTEHGYEVFPPADENGDPWPEDSDDNATYEPVILMMDPKLGRGPRPWLQRNCWLGLEPSSWLWPRWWAAGTQGCCAVWYYRTPWGALHGAWGLHRSRQGRHRVTGGMPRNIPLRTHPGPLSPRDSDQGERPQR